MVWIGFGLEPPVLGGVNGEPLHSELAEASANLRTIGFAAIAHGQKPGSFPCPEAPGLSLEDPTPPRIGVWGS